MDIINTLAEEKVTPSPSPGFPHPDPEHNLTLIIVGMGRIGTALWSLYVRSMARIVVVDPARGYPATYPVAADIMHYCVPYSDTYMDDALSWIVSYEPATVLLHNLQPVGTTRLIRNALTKTGFPSINVYHMPVVGEHPLLSEYLKGCIQVIGPDKVDNAVRLCSENLLRLGIRTAVFNSSEETELASVTAYVRLALDRVFSGLVMGMCDQMKLNGNQILFGWTEMSNRVRVGNRVGDTLLLPNVDYESNPALVHVMNESLKTFSLCLESIETRASEDWMKLLGNLVRVASFHESRLSGGEFTFVSNLEPSSEGRTGSSARSGGGSGNKRKRASRSRKKPDTPAA